MPNAWISHVKDFADKKKMKYTDALKSQECKDAYKSSKPKKETSDITVKVARKKTPKQEMDKSIIEPMKVIKPPMEMMPPVPIKMKRVKTKKAMME